MTGEGRQTGFLARADRLGQLAENAALVLVLSGMIVLAGLQIVLRNFLDSGIPWGDEALRLMVLWVAMLGAVAASRDNRHIAIDVLSKILPERGQVWVSIVVHAFTAGVAFVIAWYSGQFVADSYEFQDRLLDDLPAWLFQAILPMAFGLIGYRYSIWCLRRCREVFSGVGVS